MWDVFVCHASEDKDRFVRFLAQSLQKEGLAVWYDEFTLTVGDSLRRRIDEGLARSKYGVVVLSPSFFGKEWPQTELDGLAAREVNGQKVILPVWLDMNRDDVAVYSPTLAGRYAAKAADGMAKVVYDLLLAMGLPTSSQLQHSTDVSSAKALEIIVVDNWNDIMPAEGAKVIVSGQGAKLADANGLTQWTSIHDENIANVTIEYASPQGPQRIAWGGSNIQLKSGHRYSFYVGTGNGLVDQGPLE